MESHLLSIFALLLLAVAVSHASLPSEDYWNTVLPNTPMPKAVLELLHPDLEEEKSTSVNVGKGSGVNVNTGKPGGRGTSVNVGKGGVNVNTGKPGRGGTTVNVGGRKGGVHVNTGKPGGGKTKVNVGKGGVNVHTGKKGKPVYVGVGGSPFQYVYAASADQLRDDPNVALFFLEKDLKAGKKLNLHFTRTTTGATFLPRELANAIPFSSKKLPQVMEKFSVNPKSIEGEAMKETLETCEEPAQEGEEKYCATSLESMLDFSVSKLGKNVVPMSTEVDKEESLRQEYTIALGVKQMGGETSVVCHSKTYAYAVFYCHETHSTKAYKVPLVGVDGTKASAVAVCHTDTSKWNPKHMAFQVLKVKPGTVPICHFLPQDHIVWTLN